ncbi:hypothetical protein LGQ03_07260 [Loktanella sp. TSTF-M6]|uniref:DUF7146 domain-containing protein n=1 Tax=Loktanella gaetbuli TaxID=2881335 RepID=A0ABS8BTY2_9RHOB|nr:hypothetical protein [Loktanella gaetbuli]MCB5199034.1 hypothetical protein [Loktanella gaetbuli]
MMPDARLDEAKAIPIEEVAERLGLLDGLRRAGHEWVGPCPACGGTDRFGINPHKNVYNCRHCGGVDNGCDGLGLVRLVLGVDFPTALSWLVGERAAEIDPAEARRRAEQRAREQERRDAVAERMRQESIRAGAAIWDQGLPAAGTAVSGYLSLRGLPSAISDKPPSSLRFHPALPYLQPNAGGQGWVTLHTGPAMLAACRAPNGQLTAVHRTWIDLDRPKGKAVICDASGQPVVDAKGRRLAVKKLLGSKRRAAIRFYNVPRFDTLVMGEGIETTLTALAARAFDGAAYWAGIDLGHMAGKRDLRGAGMKYAGIPDYSDLDGFVPPPWTKRLVFIQDGDSDPKATRAKLLSGLRRAKHHIPELRTSIVHAGEGMDLNDVLMGKSEDDQ